MKILKVRSLNINSLKGEFAIDFEAFLKDQSLFAITGPTGAGKSTVLDIITCALYGRTPRLTNPNELMSRHTGESLCEVEFEVKGKNYRSSWTQKRARKKADGKFQTAKMELVDLDSGKILESKLRDVPKVLEEISGLDFERFVQSMMLAQGSFDAFLKAKENERSNLLEKITGTYIYKQISQEVYETYAEKKKIIDEATIALGTIELLEKEELEKKTKSLEAAKEEKLSLDLKEKELKNIATWLETLQKLETDERKYSEAFEQISKTKEEKKEDFLKLSLANRALRIEPINKEKNLLAKTIEEEKIQLDSLQKELEELQTTSAQKEQEFTTLKGEFEKEKNSYETNSKKLKECRVLQTKKEGKIGLVLDNEQKIIKQKKELGILLAGETVAEQSDVLNRLKEKYQKIATAFETMAEQTKDHSAKEQKIRERLYSIEEVLKALEEYEKLLEKIDKEKKQTVEYEKKIESQTKLNSEKTKLIEQIEGHLVTLKATREKELMIKKYEDDRTKLKEGEACYLCGSKEHPYIEHSLQIDFDETVKKIQEQEQLLAKETRELQANEIELTKLNSRSESSTLEIKKLESSIDMIEELFERHRFKIEQNSRLDLQEKKLAIEKELSDLTVLREAKEKLSIQKGDLQNRLAVKEKLQIQTTNLITSINSLKAEQNQLTTDIKTLEDQSKKILDVEDLNLFEQTITKAFATVQERYNTLQNQLTSLSSKAESLSKQSEQLGQKQIADKGNLEILNEKFEKVLEEYGFQTKIEFEQALLPKELFESLSASCKAIEDEFSQINTLKSDTAEKLKEHKAVQLSERELESVNEELEQLQNTIDTLQKSIGSVEKELEINATNMNKQADKIKELEKKKEAFKGWVKLNEMIGSATGDKFAKFAQGITLDQLIYLANKHLGILSPRYELQRGVDSSKLLEIEIVDGFQGDAVRGVNTLSGGESFIVSLSLALGLSSLASQKISIDSLFLDEGFGTLDSESLELALNALNQLQSSGKMVGVISHVEALKERIPLQIKIEPRGDGTSSVFTLSSSF